MKEKSLSKRYSKIRRGDLLYLGEKWLCRVHDIPPKIFEGFPYFLLELLNPSNLGPICPWDIFQPETKLGWVPLTLFASWRILSKTEAVAYLL